MPRLFITGAAGHAKKNIHNNMTFSGLARSPRRQLRCECENNENS